mmetsp:Transcript_42826/g.91422  ORF Transcript_42826/g.91422 Transcript_42826/m.91422 type:complete len:213 (+) Transcript_42826:245-883(+)
MHMMPHTTPQHSSTLRTLLQRRDHADAEITPVTISACDAAPSAALWTLAHNSYPSGSCHVDSEEVERRLLHRVGAERIGTRPEVRLELLEPLLSRRQHQADDGVAYQHRARNPFPGDSEAGARQQRVCVVDAHERRAVWLDSLLQLSHLDVLIDVVRHLRREQALEPFLTQILELLALRYAEGDKVRRVALLVVVGGDLTSFSVLGDGRRLH